MRCTISYKNGPFYGSVEFGVFGEADPAVLKEKARLLAKGAQIRLISFW